MKTDEKSGSQPLRSQTGLIMIANEEGLHTINTFLAEDAVAAPVLLIRKSAGGSESIAWQGFLSTDVYQQDYINVPTHITLNINSVLEASGKVDLGDMSKPMMSLRELVYLALDTMQSHMPYSTIEHVYFPDGSDVLFDQMIDTSYFVSTVDNVNEYTMERVRKNVYCSYVLEEVCKIAGCSMREDGGDIYLQDISSTRGYRRYDMGVLNRYTLVPQVQRDMSSVTSRGTSNTYYIDQSARSVSVRSKVEEYKMELSLPDSPVDGTAVRGTMNIGEGVLDPQGRRHYDQLDVAVPTTGGHYNFVTLRHYTAMMRRQDNTHTRMVYNENSYSAVPYLTCINKACVMPGSAYKQWVQTPTTYNSIYAGAFLGAARLREVVAGDVQYRANSYKDYDNGLYCMLLPESIYREGGTYIPERVYDQSKVGAIYEISSVKPVSTQGGYLALDVDCMLLVNSLGNKTVFNFMSLDSDKWYEGYEPTIVLEYELQIGNFWWDGEYWVDYQTTFMAKLGKKGFINEDFAKEYEKIDGNDSKLIIPLTNRRQHPTDDKQRGIATLKIWPGASAVISQKEGQAAYLVDIVPEMLYKSISLEYRPYDYVGENYMVTDKSENVLYHRFTDSAKDEVEVGLDFCSDFCNKQALSALRSPEDEKMVTTIPYKTNDGYTENEHPETHLLWNIRRHYGKVRRRISMETLSNTEALPTLRYTGYDGLAYLPMSNSHEWRKAVSKIEYQEVWSATWH